MFYNTIGDYMKKIFPIVLGLIVGLVFTKLFYDQYDSSYVFSGTTKVYVFQQGVYSNVDSIDDNVDLNYYVYEKQGDMYYVYVAFTTNDLNVTKLKGYFDSMGYSIYVKEIDLVDSSFIETLKQYDLLLESIDDDKSIDAINASVLSKYMEVYGGN